MRRYSAAIGQSPARSGRILAEFTPMISTFDLFKIGIGPSSSHTMGPMRAAKAFVTALERQTALNKVARVGVDLFGSLALTGLGHGIDRALILGLEGEEADRVDVATIDSRLVRVRAEGMLRLGGVHPTSLSRGVRPALPQDRGVADTHQRHALHRAGPSGSADPRARVLLHWRRVHRRRRQDSSGCRRVGRCRTTSRAPPTCYGMCREGNLRIADVVLANEHALPERDVRAGLLQIWAGDEGVHPTRLGDERRAAGWTTRPAACVRTGGEAAAHAPRRIR